MSQRRSFQKVVQAENQRRRYEQSDVQHRIYVRPLGNTGLHIVKSRPNGAEYQVAGPARTFKPDQIVPTGRHVGTQGETILIEPPPGKRGTALPPVSNTDPPIQAVTGDGGIIPVSGTYPGHQTNWDQEGSGYTPSIYVELTGCTNRAGASVPGFSVILAFEYSTSETINMHTTTIDSYLATGDEFDPHPGFYVNFYSDVPPAGKLVGVSEWLWYQGV